MDENCKRRLDNTGYPIVFGEEVVLVFGGMTQRNKTFGADKKRIFDSCEDYSILTG